MFGRRAMRGVRRRMAQDRLRRRRLSNVGKRSRATNARGSASSSERDRLNKLINKRQRAPYTKPTDAELRKGNTGSRVTPVQDRGPRRAVDPIRTGAKHSGQGRGGRGGIPSVKPIKGSGPKMMVDPKRPTTRVRHSGQSKGGQGGLPALPSPVNTQPKLKPATIRARHSGQGIGGRGGIPDVKAPRPYFKGGNVTPTKNAIGTNDYRKTGTTLSVKDNRKKTK
jgi:hypothetical protein